MEEEGVKRLVEGSLGRRGRVMGEWERGGGEGGGGSGKSGISRRPRRDQQTNSWPSLHGQTTQLAVIPRLDNTVGRHITAKQHSGPSYHSQTTSQAVSLTAR